MKFAICNLGCKVNNYESNWYRQQLSKQYQEVDFKEFSDIYIINESKVQIQVKRQRQEIQSIVAMLCNI